MAERLRKNWKARYQVVGPKEEVVNYNEYYIDDNGALQSKPKSEKMKCWMVYFPHGHSIRVTSWERLVELGYHIKPRIVDMDTGDIVELGGDPYDFASDHGYQPDADIILAEDGELEEAPVGQSTKRKTADANA